MFLALLETGSNQRYIFDTNRLRDAVGASHLVAEVGRYAAQQVREEGTLVLSASGKVEALFGRRERAVQWIADATRRFACCAPGLDLAGAIVEHRDDLDTTRSEGHRALARARGQRAGPALRHRTLPFLRPGDDSGDPALDEQPPSQPLDKRLSEAVLARRRAFSSSREAIEARLREVGCSAGLVSRVEKALEALGAGEEPLASEQSWRAVVHADGNGLGRVFLSFGALSGATDDEGYIEQLSAFSHAIDEATWGALGAALQVLSQRLPGSEAPLPVYPLLVGGDDLTLVIDGRWALPVTRAYLEAFEQRTAQSPVIREVMSRAAERLGGARSEGLSACAGVAIVKRDFPFSVAYALAEDLCRCAKEAVRTEGGSALDWHVVYDASPPELSVLRQHLRADGVCLTRRPYRLGALDALDGAVTQLRATDEDGRRILPGGPLHDVRQGLFVGREEARLRWRALGARACRTERGREVFAALEGCLGGALVDDGGRTLFVDALDVQDFLVGVGA